MKLFKRKREIATEPTTVYTEIHAHRGGALVGYIPESIFDEITGRTSRDGVFWIRSEDSERIRAHPNFISARVGEPAKETP